MPELKWTRGFCDNLKCGRYIRHFGIKCTCPQCGKKAPNQAKKGLSTFGIDYLFGYFLGTLTCYRWSVSRIIERILLKMKIKPRVGDELTVYLYLLLSFLAFIGVSSYRVCANNVVGVLLAVFFIYRVTEIISIRVRIILYDRRLLSWKHASYARSLILLFFNICEIIFVFAILYALAFTSLGAEYTSNFRLLIYSLSGWESGLFADDFSPDNLVIHLITLSKNAVLFLLVGLGLSALINMMSAGAEVHRK